MEKVRKKALYWTIITGVIGSVFIIFQNTGSHYIEKKMDEKMESKKAEPKEQGAGNDYLFIGNINDPDGYTNVRFEPSLQSKIVGKIYLEEDFEVLDLVQGWYRVKTSKGLRGYVYSNRVVRK